MSTYIDAHCHLDHSPLIEDLEEVLREARAVGVTEMILGGTSPHRWDAHQSLARAQEGIYWTVGHHPVYVAQEGWDPSTLDLLSQRLSMTPLPVGVGEIGLDRRDGLHSTTPQQEVAFRAQLALSRERELPIVLHVVRAHGRALEILRTDRVSKAGGIIHAFSGSLEIAQEYLKLGLKPSLGGRVTYPTAKKIRRVAAQLSERDFVLETDAPDQPLYTPSPARPLSPAQALSQEPTAPHPTAPHPTAPHPTAPHPTQHQPARLIEIAYEIVKLRRGHRGTDQSCEMSASMRRETHALLYNCSSLTRTIFRIDPPSKPSINPRD